MDKYQKEAATWKAKEAKIQAKAQKVLDKIKLPKLQGFVETTEKNELGHTDRVLTNEEFKVKFIYQNQGIGTTKYWYEPQGKPGFWASFDRRGVDNSFYWIDHSYTKGKPDVVKTIVEMIEIFKNQIDKVKKMREYGKSAIQIPQIGFSTSPAGKAEHIKRIQDTGYTQFTPSGFGTGYTLSRRKLYSYSKPAGKELIDFFGLGPLWISTMDCD